MKSISPKSSIAPIVGKFSPYAASPDCHHTGSRKLRHGAEVEYPGQPADNTLVVPLEYAGVVFDRDRSLPLDIAVFIGESRVLAVNAKLYI